MAPIYDKPVRILLKDMASEMGLKKGDVILRDQVFEWFTGKYPRIKPGTIHAHLFRMSTNLPSRVHYSVNSNGDDDLFFRIDTHRFRLYDPGSDPTPIYEDQPRSQEQPDRSPGESSEFAYEKDLRNFLSKNLSALEPGLTLYEDDGINGIEFPVGGRFIDILGVIRTMTT